MNLNPVPLCKKSVKHNSMKRLMMAALACDIVT
jgi:hypothetical protein